MNKKNIKILLASLLALGCVFFGLMSMDRSVSSPPLPKINARASFQKALAEARASSDARENMAPSYSTGLTTESVRSEGSIMLVKSADFGGVSEEPQGVMSMLTGLSGSNRRKVTPVHLTDASLRKKVMIDGSGKPPAPLNPSAVYRLGESTSQLRMGEKTMITAPVDYQLFKSSETWSAFASSHKGRFPAADFSREQMLILVSVSDLPSGIFKVAGVNRSAKETVVSYRVDPLAMAAETGAKEKDFYSAVPVPRTLPVRLEQVP